MPPARIMDFLNSSLDDWNNNATASITLGEWSWYPYSWSWVVIFEVVTSIVGILGNGLVITVLTKQGKNMGSTDTIIRGLAVADFLTSLFLIPVPNIRTAPNTFLGRFYCKVIRPEYHMWMQINASSLILTALSIERYIAVVHPIYYRTRITARKASVAIALLWVIAALGSLGLFHSFLDPVDHTCKTGDVISQLRLILAVTTTSIRLFVPVIVMLFTNIAIVINLHRQWKRSKAMTNNSKTSANSKEFHIVAKTRMIRLLLTVIFAFVICWSPFSFLAILFIFRVVKPSAYITTFKDAFILMGFCNSCLNPIIYTIRLKKFRKAAAQLFTRRPSTDSAPLFQ